MKILQVNGYTEHCGDWTLAAKLREAGHDVLERECVQNWNALHVTLEDVLWADVVCGYSFGVSSLWDVTDGWKKVVARGHKLELLCLVAGCPDWMKGQFDVWTAPPSAKRCFSFNTNRGYPTSSRLKGIGQYAFAEQCWGWDQLHSYNIECDSLFPAGITPIDIHKTIQNRPEVLDAIAGLVASVGSVNSVVNKSETP